jgi:hypothetical protein
MIRTQDLLNMKQESCEYYYIVMFGMSGKQYAISSLQVNTGHCYEGGHRLLFSRAGFDSSKSSIQAGQDHVGLQSHWFRY